MEIPCKVFVKMVTTERKYWNTTGLHGNGSLYVESEVAVIFGSILSDVQVLIEEPAMKRQKKQVVLKKITKFFDIQDIFKKLAK